MKLGLALPNELKREIQRMLLENADLFTWVASDMPGIDPNFVCHRLNIDPQAKPVAQR